MTGELFLASTVSPVIQRIASQMNSSPQNKKLLFITTASEAESGDKKWLSIDRESLKKVGFRVEEYSITGKNASELQRKVADFDFICVAGGNSFYLLEKILQSGFDKTIQKWVENGGTYIGSSAGSVVAGSDIEPVKALDNSDKAPSLKTYKGMGLADIVLLPHWGNPKFKERYLNQRLEQSYQKRNKIIRLTDDQYLHVRGKIFEIVDIKK